MRSFNDMQENNICMYKKGSDIFCCVICGRSARWDESFSCRGANLICEECVGKISHILGITCGELVIRLHETWHRHCVGCEKVGAIQADR